MFERAARRPERRRRRALVLAAIGVAIGAVVFTFGLALGQALDENPQPAGSVTLVRTLEPLSVAPERETVTVTVEG
jgi:hypothetical protein